MELFAAGFNAFGQLSFDASMTPDDPDDWYEFSPVLRGAVIQRPTSHLTYTAVYSDQHLHEAGVGRRAADGVPPQSCVYDETANGVILVAQLQHPASTDAVELTTDSHVLVRYPSLDAWRVGAAGDIFPCGKAVRQIAALEAGFVILFEDGTVATMGEARFEACLGREVSEESPADRPAIVRDLCGLDGPIRHVAAGSYTAVALTQHGSAYVWGMHSVGTQHIQGPFPTLSATPNYIEIDGGKDVRDVALGDSHAIALTTDGFVYVLGENSNGQLGLGRTFKGLRTTDWRKVACVAVDKGTTAVAVAAGPRASFILTSRSQPTQRWIN